MDTPIYDQLVKEYAEPSRSHGVAYSDKVRGAEIVLGALETVYTLSEYSQSAHPEFGHPEYLRGLEMALDHTRAVIRGLKRW